MTEMRCVLDAQAKLAECPRWDEQTQTLYFVDIDSFELHAYNTQSGDHSVRRFEEEIGCFSLTNNGGFIAAFRSGVYTFADFNAPLVSYWQADYDQKTTRFNDGRCDPSGRFWVGTIDATEAAPSASLYRLDGDRLTSVKGALAISNGLAFSPDGRFIYHSDSPTRQVWRYAFDAERGTLEAGELWVDLARHDLPGVPDGAAVMLLPRQFVFCVTYFEACGIAVQRHARVPRLRPPLRALRHDGRGSRGGSIISARADF